MNEPKDPMSKTRTNLVIDRPWWGALSLKLKIVPTDRVPTAETDGVELRYNPTFFETLSTRQREGLLAHEVEHCALLHPFRIGSREHELTNIAMDHVVNLDLLAAGFELPVPHLADPRFANMSFEKVYSILAAEQEKAKADEKKNDQSKKRDDTSSQSSAPDSGGQKESQPDKPAPSRPSDKKPSTKGANQPGTKADKSADPADEVDTSTGSGGGKPSAEPGKQSINEPKHEKDGFTEPSNPANWGGIASPPESTETEPGSGEAPKALDDITYEWEKAVETASLVATKAGDMPGSLLRTITESKLRREELIDTLQQFLVTKGNYSYATPNKRMLAHGYKIPGRVKSGIENIVIAVDTSGSIGHQLLSYFAEKCNEVLLLDTPPERIHVVYCDAKVQKVDEFTDGQIEFAPMGGGGTMFGPVFGWVEENDIRPDIMIFLTDLYGGDNNRLIEPDYPVLWVSPIQIQKEPPFGIGIKIDPF